LSSGGKRLPPTRGKKAADALHDVERGSIAGLEDGPPVRREWPSLGATMFGLPAKKTRRRTFATSRR